MVTNEMKCDGCNAVIDPKKSRVELKPVRGGLALVLLDVDQFKLKQFDRAYHFCNGSCAQKFVGDRVGELAAAIAEARLKKSQGSTESRPTK